MDVIDMRRQVTVQQATHEQMEKYIRSKGSEHFLGAELKLTTQGGEELKGELYCAPRAYQQVFVLHVYYYGLIRPKP